uniref:Ribonuclease H-like domain-containing protein n=1 Tax=Tanacetum cinerariifolium TaxID=118510 RepID=A0A6L2JRI4_TANCI|nr:ribonuclease H-like domain-containing protein [Tanacetum cinerariifolium]
MESYFQKNDFIVNILTSLDARVNEEDVVHYPLEGLPDTYNQVCGYMHWKHTFLDLKALHSLLIAKEMRLKSKVLALPVDSSSHMVLVAETSTNSHSSTSQGHETSENMTNNLLTKLLAQLGRMGMNVAMTNNGTDVTLPTHATVTPTFAGPNIASNVPTVPHAFYVSTTQSAPNITHLAIILDPPVNPNPTSVQSMVTRFRIGSNKPTQCLNFHVSNVSPLPKTYRVAFHDSNWQNAMRDEYDALIKISTWTLVLRPPDANVVHYMGEQIDRSTGSDRKTGPNRIGWTGPNVFRSAPQSEVLYQFGLRSVRSGPVRSDLTKNPKIMSCRTGPDRRPTRTGPYHFSPVLGPEFCTTRSRSGPVLAGPDLTKTVYMHQPPGFWDSTHPDYVCLLQRSLYGLKQAHRELDISYLLLYVDDIVLTASSSELLQRIICSLHQEFAMTDLGPLNYFLGVCVTCDSSGLFLSQQKSLAGSLWYFTFTRPDISYAVQQVCLHMHDPRKPHFSALKRILRYVQEAKYRGVANIVAETSWLRNLLRELHTPLSSATLIYCDNMSVVYLSCYPVQHQRTKHIEIDIHFVRDLVATGQFRILHVPSCYQIADIFTKLLPSALFEEFHISLSIWCPSASTAKEC